MLVNLNFDEKFIIKFLNDKTIDDVFDFTGVFQNIHIRGDVKYARQFDEDHKIENSSIENYIDTISQLNNKYLRELKAADILIWWLTHLSEKHDRNHWGQVVFYFMEFFNAKNELFQCDLEILLPDNFGGLKSFLENNIEFNQSYSQHFYDNTDFLKQKKKTIKQQLKTALYFLKFRLSLSINSSQDKSRNKYKNVFFTQRKNAVIENSDDFDIGWYKTEISNSINVPIPSIGAINSMTKFWHENQLLSNAMPSFTRLIAVIFKWKMSSSGILKRVNEVVINKLVFNQELLKNEIDHTLSNIETPIVYSWLKNLSRKHSDLNFYYSDEMYKSGRLLSMALVSDFNRRVGVQHGLIAFNHTVYRITDSDITGQNSMPLPDQFIVWNETFKEILMKSSSSINEIIELSNDVKYDSLKKEVQRLRKGKTIELKILWATTLFSHFKTELQFIKSAFSRKNVEVIIRLHPAGDITESLIEEALQGERNYVISTLSYTEDVARADALICNTISTVFYDGIMLDLPTFRIEHYGSYCNFPSKNSIMYDIHSAEKFNVCLEDLIQKKA